MSPRLLCLKCGKDMPSDRPFLNIFQQLEEHRARSIHDPKGCTAQEPTKAQLFWQQMQAKWPEPAPQPTSAH